MDPEGDITNTGPVEGITDESIEAILPKFTGEIQQGMFLSLILVVFGSYDQLKCVVCWS